MYHPTPLVETEGMHDRLERAHPDSSMLAVLYHLCYDRAADPPSRAKSGVANWAGCIDEKTSKYDLGAFYARCWSELLLWREKSVYELARLLHLGTQSPPAIIKSGKNAGKMSHTEPREFAKSDPFECVMEHIICYLIQPSDEARLIRYEYMLNSVKKDDIWREEVRIAEETGIPRQKPPKIKKKKDKVVKDAPLPEQNGVADGSDVSKNNVSDGRKEKEKENVNMDLNARDSSSPTKPHKKRKKRSEDEDESDEKQSRKKKRHKSKEGAESASEKKHKHQHGHKHKDKHGDDKKKEKKKHKHKHHHHTSSSHHSSSSSSLTTSMGMLHPSSHSIASILSPARTAPAPSLSSSSRPASSTTAATSTARPTHTVPISSFFSQTASRKQLNFDASATSRAGASNTTVAAPRSLSAIRPPPPVTSPLPPTSVFARGGAGEDREVIVIDDD